MAFEWVSKSAVNAVRVPSDLISDTDFLIVYVISEIHELKV